MKGKSFFYQFQVGYIMLNPELNINNASKEKVESNIVKSCSDAEMMHIIIFLKKGNTHVI